MADRAGQLTNNLRVVIRPDTRRRGAALKIYCGSPATSVSQLQSDNGAYVAIGSADVHEAFLDLAPLKFPWLSRWWLGHRR